MFVRRTLFIATALVVALPLAAPAHAQAEPAAVSVVAEFDQTEYSLGDVVTTTLTVTNGTDQTLFGVLGTHYGDIDYPDEAFGVFDPRGGATLEPGQSAQAVLAAELTTAPADDRVDLAIGVWTGSEYVMTDVSAAFDPGRGQLSGAAYVDYNENGAFDPGEGQADAAVLASRHSTGAIVVVRTDVGGRFQFADLLAGGYTLTFQDIHTLIAPYTTVVVEQGGEHDVTVRLKQPRSQTLRAEIRYTADTYAVGEEAEMVVRLFNSGTRPAAGIVALCNGIGDPNQVIADPVGWGALAYGESGVTVPAGTTRTYRVRSTVPEAARAWGVFIVSCAFDSEFDDGSPQASDHAKVPGATKTTNARFYEDRDGDNVIDAGEGVRVRVTLVDRFTGRAVVSGRTTRSGLLAIPDVPTGSYILRVAAPWQFEWQGTEHMTVIEGNDYRWRFKVVPRPA